MIRLLALATLASVSLAATPDFATRVHPRLVKAGCFSGACHGAGSGQGGFKLSLLGYDPEADYLAIARQYRGRRLNLVNPEDSLVAKKATLQLAHGGGRRFDLSSETYRVLLDWVRGGAPYESEPKRRITRLTIDPAYVTARTNVAVRALFSDGSVDDVTPFALYSSNDDGIAQASDTGLVTLNRAGETGITARYMGKFAVARASLPFTGDPREIEKATSGATNFIDKHINRKMRQLRLVPTARCTDSEFLRRSHLDLLGSLPAVDEVRAFLASRDPAKREKLIDALLAREEFGSYWTIWLLDLFRTSSKQVGEKNLPGFAHWLRDRLARDTPLDVLVRDLVTARGESATNPAVNFLRQTDNAKLLSELTTEALMGSRSRCAQCHDHPFDSWTQTQYHRFASFFVRVNRTETGLELADHGEVDHPKTMKPVSPGFPDDTTAQASGDDRRTALAAWLTAPSNPFFARAFANRIWARLMGRGLIAPVDDLSVSNAPTNPELLDELSAFFARTYSIKKLIREIMNTRAYQRGATPNSINAGDDRFYSRAIAVPLNAHALSDAISEVTGVAERFGKLPPGVKASGIFDAQTESYLLDVCGRCVREGSCDAPNPAAGGVRQALHFLNGPAVNAKLTAPEGRLQRLRMSNMPPARIAEEFYLAALSRPPTGAERDYWLTQLAGAEDPASALEDLVWSLLNSRAFVFNR